MTGAGTYLASKVISSNLCTWSFTGPLKSDSLRDKWTFFEDNQSIYEMKMSCHSNLPASCHLIMYHCVRTVHHYSVKEVYVQFFVIVSCKNTSPAKLIKFSYLLLGTALSFLVSFNSVFIFCSSAIAFFILTIQISVLRLLLSPLIFKESPQ